MALGVAVMLPIAFTKAQGSFQNLGFESADLPVIPQGQFGSLVPISAGMPGWTGFLGAQQTTQVLQNNLTLGDPSIDILGPDFSTGPGGIIEGNYTAVLQAGGSGVHVAATIEQSGTVPANTKSLQVKFGTGATGFAVSLDGQLITMIPLSTGPNYTLYGGDASAFAGLPEELSFSALPTASNPFNGFSLDSIVFSTSPVPEPGTCGLMLCAVVVFGMNRWRERGRV